MSFSPELEIEASSVAKKVAATANMPAPSAARFTVTLPQMQKEALDSIVQSSGLQQGEVIRNAVALLNIAFKARKRGLSLGILDDDKNVVAEIASTF